MPERPDVGFYGRDETLYELDRAFDTDRIVLLHAYAGSGKTTTATEFTRWYALTGGIYTRSPAALARARREFLVGNLYLNRPITGALVNRQPFGGFKMSGIGSKAGGRDYLLQFVMPRTITEHTVRRGFAPPLDTGE